MIFERDIEDDVYGWLLDCATSPKKHPRAAVLLSPAGYGVTTLLMTVAARLVDEQAGPVLMLRPGQSVTIGDIEFACSLFDKRPFFFIDNAAEHGETLHTLIVRLRESGKQAFFLLGERTNEWRQCRVRPTATEFDLDPLSDSEIYRLLDFLSEHNAQGVLSNLDRSMQFATIKNKHRQELLITLREATEGRNFDAILEDEYRGIGDAKSRFAYLTVCGFYQYGAYLRDSLLAGLLTVSPTELYEITRDPTEGIIIYDCIDEAMGIWGARARHRTIARIIWERCGDLGTREEILHSAIENINIKYKVDKAAFDSFVRSDILIDDIQTLDGRIRFFDRACQIEPINPYVRQHYARMFLRAGYPDLALHKIDEAIALAPNVRILHHTKGVVLAELAKNDPSEGMARRRLHQSEESFRQGIRRAPRDHYCYQGMANLYFDWAQRAVTQEEKIEYISKAEETIGEGLKHVRDRESLWVLSAKIQQWLGNQPERMQALENAIRAHPGSVIARYLLARAYRSLGQPERAIETLRPIIENHFEEFRAFAEYAVTLLSLGGSYKQAIAVLKQADIVKFRDPRFIATLGGMLFMDGQFSESDEVFQEAAKRDFPGAELRAPQFFPINPENPNEPYRMVGRVVAVKSGYCFIEVSDYPAFFCPASKYDGLIMSEGLVITFQPAFTARGALAHQPREYSANA